MDKNKKWINDIENNELKKLPKKDILLYKMPQSTNEKILDVIKNSENIDKKNKTEKIKFLNLPKILKLSFAAVCLLVVFCFVYLIFYQKNIPSIFIKNRLIAKAIFTTGNVAKINDSIKKDLTAGDLIEKQDSVATDKNTRSIIQLGDKAIVLLNENSEIQFLKISEKKNTDINISLKKGMAIFKVNKLIKNSKFKVTVNDININVIGTKFLVQFISDKSTLIAALTGKIEINSNKNNQIKKIILPENKLLIIKDDQVTEKGLPADISEYFEDIQNINNINLNDYSTLKIINNKNNIDLFLNKKKIFQFNKNLELILSTGKYLLELKQNGSLIYKEEINLISEEKILKEINVDQKNIANNNISEEKNPSLKWKSKLIYQSKNNNDLSNKKILGFAYSKNHIITLSQSAIICFDNNGELIWEKTYGKKRSIYFMSTPLIYQEKVFVSSLNKKLVVLDLKSGKELKVLDTSGNITFGYGILAYKDKLLLPYTNGIYILQITDLSLKDNVFIQFNSPTKPLIFNNKIYLSSFIEKRISGYNLEGKELWNYNLTDTSFNSPVLFNNAIFIADKKGVIYKISLDGKLIEKATLPTGAVSNINPGENHLYILANNGIIYLINYNDLNVKKLFKGDEKFDDYIYLFKRPIEYDNKILIGTDKGEIIVYDLEKNTILDRVKISNSPISTPIYQLSPDTFFAGTENGNVFLIK